MLDVNSPLVTNSFGLNTKESKSTFLNAKSPVCGESVAGKSYDLSPTKVFSNVDLYNLASSNS